MYIFSLRKEFVEFGVEQFGAGPDVFGKLVQVTHGAVGRGVSGVPGEFQEANGVLAVTGAEHQRGGAQLVGAVVVLVVLVEGDSGDLVELLQVVVIGLSGKEFPVAHGEDVVVGLLRVEYGVRLGVLQNLLTHLHAYQSLVARGLVIVHDLVVELFRDGDTLVGVEVVLAPVLVPVLRVVQTLACLVFVVRDAVPEVDAVLVLLAVPLRADVFQGESEESSAADGRTYLYVYGAGDTGVLRVLHRLGDDDRHLVRLGMGREFAVHQGVAAEVVGVDASAAYVAAAVDVHVLEVLEFAAALLLECGGLVVGEEQEDTRHGHVAVGAVRAAVRHLASRFGDDVPAGEEKGVLADVVVGGLAVIQSEHLHEHQVGADGVCHGPLLLQGLADADVVDVVVGVLIHGAVLVENGDDGAVTGLDAVDDSLADGSVGVVLHDDGRNLDLDGVDFVGDGDSSLVEALEMVDRFPSYLLLSDDHAHGGSGYTDTGDHPDRGPNCLQMP